MAAVCVAATGISPSHARAGSPAPNGSLLATLDNPNAAATSNFGGPVAVSGTTAVIGGARAAYIYTKTNDVWASTPTATLTDPDGSTADFGWWVAVSDTTVVVTAFDANGYRGVAYVYTEVGGRWDTTPTARLVDPRATANDNFGISAAISPSTIVIGAGGPSAGGDAYIYTRTDAGWPPTPTTSLSDPQATSGDNFGITVATWDTTVAVSASGANGGAGAAYVYSSENGVWPTTANTTLNDPAALAGDAFGSSVAGSGSTLLLGASGTSSSAGAAYFFTQTASGWRSTPSATLADPAATAGDRFGFATAVSGATALVGAYDTGSHGAAYYYGLNAGGWYASPEITLPDPNATQGDSFGVSVSISGGSTFVGANQMNAHAGGTYIYQADESASATSLSTDLDPAVSGQVVTFVATVAPAIAGAGSPTGTVAFTDEDSPLPGCGGVQISAAGTATCAVSSLATGHHSVSATYSGDATFSGSVAGPLDQVVDQGSTTIDLTSDHDPSTVGQYVTLHATVSTVAPGVGNPAGTVDFEDNGAAIPGCSAVALSVTDSAACSTSSMSPGTHEIAAVYNGDVNFAASTSLTLADTVVPFHGVVLDGYGGLHSFGVGETFISTGYWRGWNIARGLVLRTDAVSGYVLDGWGGLHPFGTAGNTPPAVKPSGYWRGWDIARGIVLNPCDPSGDSGYVLDGWGGIHPFGNTPPVRGTGYWPGKDVATAIAVNPCSGGAVSGYVLDAWGGLHSFSNAAPVAAPRAAYWPGLDVARGIVLTDAGRGYTLDMYGGLHPYGGASLLSPPPLHSTTNPAIGVTMTQDGRGGYIAYSPGRIHEFGSVATPTALAAWPAGAVTRGIAAP